MIFLSPTRVTVLSAVGTLRRNIWFEGSTGAAMSRTSWRAMTPLKAHRRSRPHSRPAASETFEQPGSVSDFDDAVQAR
jgi:hypothetical protein